MRNVSKSFKRLILIPFILGANVVLIACNSGGDTDPGNSRDEADSEPLLTEGSLSQVVEPTYIHLKSDAGDYIGQGQDYSYSQADSLINVTSTGSQLSISLDGNENWNATFALPSAYTELQPGSYTELTRYPFHEAAVGGLSWSGEGRGCNTLTGWVIVDSVSYEEGELRAIDLRFQQNCSGNFAALHGEIHWTADDTTQPSGPVTPPPGTLWDADAGALPASGNYIYLESEMGDYIGAGVNYLYTGADVNISDTDAQLSVSVNTTEYWNGTFQAMNLLNELQVGYYGDLKRYPFHNPVKGGLSWTGEGRGCNELAGWFVVDSVSYVGVQLTAIDVRFEQYCDASSGALHGKIHWDINN